MTKRNVLYLSYIKPYSKMILKLLSFVLFMNGLTQHLFVCVERFDVGHSSLALFPGADCFSGIVKISSIDSILVFSGEEQSPKIVSSNEPSDKFLRFKSLNLSINFRQRKETHQSECHCSKRPVDRAIWQTGASLTDHSVID